MAELAVLVAANLLATAVRFVLLRGWVFHPRRTTTEGFTRCPSLQVSRPSPPRTPSPSQNRGRAGYCPRCSPCWPRPRCSISG
ncbi:hypothetical protein C6A85_39240, partial [Mycobacterium sp. ITM-2017-0098]